jgi:hypothetical protein
MINCNELLRIQNAMGEGSGHAGVSTFELAASQLVRLQHHTLTLQPWISQESVNGEVQFCGTTSDDKDLMTMLNHGGNEGLSTERLVSNSAGSAN